MDLPRDRQEALRARAATLAREGRRAVDDVLVRWRCACGAEGWDAAPRPQHPDAPPPPADLVAALGAALPEVTAGLPPPPCACGARPRPVAAARHVLHGDRGADLVLERDLEGGPGAGGPAATLAWWDPRAGAAAPLAGPLPPEDAAALARDALLRHLEGRLAVADGDGFCAGLARAAADHAGEPALLDLLVEALRFGAPGRAAARAVLDAHRAAGRADPRRAEVEARLAAARLAVAGVGRGLEAPEALDGAAADLDAALALDPDHLEAALLRASVLRARGALDAARAALEAVLARHPTCAEALLALGELHLAAGAPAEALARFAAAEAADPGGGADAALGQARALLRLGRVAEADAAAARGRARDPDHPRLGAVEHEVERRLGREPADGARVLVDVVGLDGFGEATLERGVVRLREAGDDDEQRRNAAWDLCCRLRVVAGSALVRALDGRPLRLWRVEGDGRCCTVTPHDDPEAVADFVGEFDALWA